MSCKKCSSEIEPVNDYFGNFLFYLVLSDLSVSLIIQGESSICSYILTVDSYDRKDHFFRLLCFRLRPSLKKIQAVKNPWRTSIFSYILQTIRSNKMIIRLHLFIHVTNILRTLNWKKKIQYLSYGYHLLWTRLKFKTSNSLLQLQIIS